MYYDELLGGSEAHLEGKALTVNLRFDFSKIGSFKSGALAVESVQSV